MGQFDFITVATMAMEAAFDDTRAAKTEQEIRASIEDFEYAAEEYVRALKHKIDLTKEGEKELKDANTELLAEDVDE